MEKTEEEVSAEHQDESDAMEVGERFPFVELAVSGKGKPKLFRDEPSSDADKKARERAIEYANNISEKEQEKLEKQLQMLRKANDRMQINKILNRKSAKVSRELKKRYILELEEQAKALMKQLSEIEDKCSKVADK
mmetsp:Transcript_10942/g.33559  ORF Transcript_10942/g.33559 Transcript_10942/m.33559 type:complete len:136 (+) Transcript_10942:77-484(+)